MPTSECFVSDAFIIIFQAMFRSEMRFFREFIVGVKDEISAFQEQNGYPEQDGNAGLRENRFSAAAPGNIAKALEKYSQEVCSSDTSGLFGRTQQTAAERFQWLLTAPDDAAIHWREFFRLPVDGCTWKDFWVVFYSRQSYRFFFLRGLN